jgi:hypothetical protein
MRERKSGSQKWRAGKSMMKGFDAKLNSSGAVSIAWKNPHQVALAASRSMPWKSIWMTNRRSVFSENRRSQLAFPGPTRQSFNGDCTLIRRPPTEDARPSQSSIFGQFGSFGRRRCLLLGLRDFWLLARTNNGPNSPESNGASPVNA